MQTTAVRGPILNPHADRSVEFLADGVIVSDSAGARIDFAGPYDAAAHAKLSPRRVDGLIIPPLTDCHIHIPQHPIRGRFVEGVGDDTPNGRLLAGLERNVFPAEAQCDDAAVAERVVWRFLQDTLAQGVVGGAAYMTISAIATRVALEILPPSWSVGLVLMNQNCPEYLRTDEFTLDHDIESLAGDFGRRLIVTDRFAVAVGTPLRKRAVELASRFDLRMQTHLNEQIGEKAFVERVLYPHAGTYTNVYAADGLLDHAAILTHCVHMSDGELDQVKSTGSFVAHCPTSNALLGSGVMPLDKAIERDIPYAICTDVGASPTTSLLAEMAVFLRVHQGRSAHATPSEALYRTSLATDAVMQRPARAASFAKGEQFSFAEVDSFGQPSATASADDVIRSSLLGHALADDELRAAYDKLALAGLQLGPAMAAVEEDIAATASRLEGRVQRVTLAGQVVFDRNDEI